MAIALVALHYPRPDHRDELVRRMQAAAEVMRKVEGCSDASVWEVRESEAVVSTGTFASEEAWADAVRAVLEAEIDFDYDRAGDASAGRVLPRAARLTPVRAVSRRGGRKART